MSLFCIHLDDANPLFNPGFVLPHFNERRHITTDLTEDINPYWHELMDKHNLEIVWVELFYYPEGLHHNMIIHTDGGSGDKAKINWVFGGKDSVMNWFKIIKHSDKEFMKTPISSDYHKFEPDEVQLIHTNIIKNPTIVQVGIPHNIINPGHERWCYSLVAVDKDTKRNASFGKLKRIFESKNT